MKFNSKILVLMIISATILYSILIMTTDLRDLSNKLSSFKMEYLPAIIALISVGWFLFFKRWDMLLKNLGICIPFTSNLGIFFSGFAMGFTPGRIGEFFKSYILKEKHGVSLHKTAPLVIIERLYDTVGAILASLIGISLLPVISYIIVIPSVIVIMIFIAFSSRLVFDKFFNISSRIKFLARQLEPLSKSYDVVRISTKGKIAVFSSLLSVGSWLVTSLAVYLIIIAYGIDNLNFLTVVPAFTVSSLLGAVSFIPGGLGVTEGTLAGLLTLLHVNKSSIFVVTILVRFFTLWFGVLVGFIALKLSKAISTNEPESTNQDD